MVRAWLRKVRWSATATALAGVVALLGAAALVSSVVAAREPTGGVPASSSAAASLAAVTSARVTTTARVATTSVERRPVRSTTTTTTSPATTTTAAGATARTTIVRVEVGAAEVSFATSTSADPAAPCEADPRWRVPRTHPEAAVAVTEDGQRLEERDPTTGEVLAVLATWDEAAGRPTGEGVAEAEPGGCAPEDPSTTTTTTATTSTAPAEAAAPG